MKVTIHGNGIFTYIPVDFYGKCRYIYHTWMLWICTNVETNERSLLLLILLLPDPLSQIACMSVSEGALPHRSRWVKFVTVDDQLLIQNAAEDVTGMYVHGETKHQSNTPLTSGWNNLVITNIDISLSTKTSSPARWFTFFSAPKALAFALAHEWNEYRFRTREQFGILRTKGRLKLCGDLVVSQRLAKSGSKSGSNFLLAFARVGKYNMFSNLWSQFATQIFSEPAWPVLFFWGVFFKVWWPQD